MSWGPKQVFTVSIASAASTSGALDTGDKSYKNFAVNVATSATNAAITIYGSTSSTGTYFPVNERVNTATVQHQPLTIATTTSGNWAINEAVPFRYLKFVASATMDNGTTITAIFQD